jgi:hypothetical protein
MPGLRRGVEAARLVAGSPRQAWSQPPICAAALACAYRGEIFAWFISARLSTRSLRTRIHAYTSRTLLVHSETSALTRVTYPFPADGQPGCWATATHHAVKLHHHRDMTTRLTKHSMITHQNASGLRSHHPPLEGVAHSPTSPPRTPTGDAYHTIHPNLFAAGKNRQGEGASPRSHTVTPPDQSPATRR